MDQEDHEATPDEKYGPDEIKIVKTKRAASSRNNSSMLESKLRCFPLCVLRRCLTSTSQVLGELLLDFLHLFGEDFDVACEGFSVRGGGFRFNCLDTPPHPRAGDPIVIEVIISVDSFLFRASIRIGFAFEKDNAKWGLVVTLLPVIDHLLGIEM